jgi:hypothetical protein
MSFKVPNVHRIRSGPMGSSPDIGNNGAFIVPLRHRQKVNVVASDGLGWEHVSAAIEKATK